jgi:hypothetical protein
MENQNLNLQIKNLVERTTQGKVIWSLSNGVSASWCMQNNNRHVTVTISRQLQPGIRAFNNPTDGVYTLTIQCTHPRQIAMQINTNEDPALREDLYNLFKEAKVAALKKMAEVIGELLETV